ncbi:hypothetical protein K440DRAFT_103190 [Wilcoxina mikolae CBS 423.85]|nr:hypothetical protein K440DRAFT_103190 [Wilcoxina mikolae CBS 423.85]
MNVDRPIDFFLDGGIYYTRAKVQYQLFRILHLSPAVTIHHPPKQLLAFFGAGFSLPTLFLHIMTSLCISMCKIPRFPRLNSWAGIYHSAIPNVHQTHA